MSQIKTAPERIWIDTIRSYAGGDYIIVAGCSVPHIDGRSVEYIRADILEPAKRDSEINLPAATMSFDYKDA